MQLDSVPIGYRQLCALVVKGNYLNATVYMIRVDDIILTEPHINLF